jgi:hypothetical protein
MTPNTTRPKPATSRARYELAPRLVHLAVASPGQHVRPNIAGRSYG